MNPKHLHIEDEPLGIDFHLNELNLLLSTHLNDIRAAGIYGSGGISKTTIAKMVCNEIQYHFTGASFLQDVSERFKNGCQLQLQKQVLQGIVRKVSMKESKWYMDLCQKRLVLSLTTWIHLKQINSLAEKLIWFGAGSRIIITTKDQHLFIIMKCSHDMRLQKVRDEEVLVNRHDFKQVVPREDYVHLSKCMIHYAQGLPLSLKVLGSYL